MPSHYLDQCWNIIVYWTLRNKVHLNRNLYTFIEEKAFEMSSGKWRAFCLGLSKLNVFSLVSADGPVLLGVLTPARSWYPSLLPVHIWEQWLKIEAIFVIQTVLSNCIRFTDCNTPVSQWFSPSGEQPEQCVLLSGVPDYFYRNKISSGGDLSHYSSASLY